MSVRESGAEMLTVEEVAERLRLSVSKVYEMLEAGEIPHYKFGRSETSVGAGFGCVSVALPGRGQGEALPGSPATAERFEVLTFRRLLGGFPHVLLPLT